MGFFLSFFPCWMTSELGWKKPTYNPTTHPPPLLRPLQLLVALSPPPPLLYSPPSFVEKLIASVIRAQSVEVAGFWTMPQSKPWDSWVHREDGTSEETRRFHIQLQDSWTSEDQEWDTERPNERWVLSNVAQTINRWDYNCRTYAGITGNIKVILFSRYFNSGMCGWVRVSGTVGECRSG